MKREYSNWIKTNVNQETHGYGECHEVSHAMAAVFTELTVKKGFYHCHSWGRRTHWWLVDEDGQIVDPTARQFPSAGRGDYQAISDDELPELVPTGRCMDCGDDVYKGATFCNRSCENSYAAYLNDV